MKISVHMITYNHEKYIAKAIESVLMQKGEFDLELVIGDDVSLDKTREVILKYYKKYPEIIKLNFHQKNVGPTQNFKSTLEMCTGDYVAILEGDDFWIDEYKLNKQLEFLEKNMDYSMCFTKTKFLYEEEQRYDIQELKHIKNSYKVEELLKGNFIFHLTCLFRNIDIKDYPQWLWQYKILDYPMHLLRGTYGKIGFINEVTSVYRIHNGGLSRNSNKAWWYIQMIGMLDDFNKYTNFRFNKLISTRIGFYNSYLAVYETNKKRAIQAFKKGLFYNIFSYKIAKKKCKFILNLVRGKYDEKNKEF